MLALIDGPSGQSGDAGWTSAKHRTGGERDSTLTDPPEFWALGNTPFEREDAYRRRLAAPPAPDTVASLRRAVLGGWPVASPAFAATLAASTGRAARPRSAGRPRSAAG